MNKKIEKLLTDWDEYSKADYFLCPGTELLAYGTGYGGWAVQTNQKALGAVAVLGVTTQNKSLIEKALRMLRFSLESHLAGSFCCLDGKKWGNTWISVLGIERMMHGVDLLIPYMTDNDKALLEKIFISEANWLMDCYTVVADPIAESGNNHPESNAWNGAFLYRVSKMFPHCPRAAEYEEKAESYLLNSISVPSDCNKKGFIGANFFENFALNHHSYLNVGYMVITLSQIAMLHFFCKKNNVAPPKNLYNHVEELWTLVKSCTAPDGRLLRIGGDSRFRYCYCQDYAVPVWLFAKDYLKDRNCDAFLDGWIKQIEKEVSANGDGSFLSERCGKIQKPSPIYYTRLESDRACSLSMVLTWNAETPCRHIPTLPIWYDKYHGAAFMQNESNFISWAWNDKLETPMGLVIPKSDSSMAEWEWNLAGFIKGLGQKHCYEKEINRETVLDNCFFTAGKVKIKGEMFLAEQQTEDNIAEVNIAFCALPDCATAIILQKINLYENTRSYVTEYRGLNLNIPNDLFNDFSRTYKSEMGVFNKRFGEKSIFTLGKWVNVDDKLGVALVYGQENLKLISPEDRNTVILNSKGIDTSHMYTESIVSEYCREQKDYWGNKVLVDCGCALVCGNDNDTKNMIPSEKFHLSLPENTGIRYAHVQDKNNKQYLFVANMGSETETVTFGKSLYDVETKESISGYTFEKTTAKLYML